MLLCDFLDSLEGKIPKIAHFCAIHLLKKQYDTDKDSLSLLQLKEIFTNYALYHRYLNDYAGVIYNKFDSSTDEVYAILCEYFEENSDNESLFMHRLTRIGHQDPQKYLSIDDAEMRTAAILRLEDKLTIIENSLYYQNNQALAQDSLSALRQSLDLVKRAAGIS